VAVAVNRRTLTLLRKLATQVGGVADDTVRELTAAWIQAWDELSPAWQQAIAAIVDQYTATGVWPAPWQIARIEAVARATERTRQSLTLLLTEAAVTTGAATAAVSAATVTAEPLIIASQLPAALQVAAAVGLAGAAAAGLTARRQRISALHRPVITEAVDVVRRAIARPPTSLGDPAQLARDVYNRVRAGFDGGLTRAVTIARTEPIDTYRTAAGIVHTANRNVVTGWCWICACDRRSCPACWAMHGTRWPLDEPGPLGHPGCRCTRLPVVGDAAVVDGETRFRRLPRRDQLAVLGAARLGLFRAGRIAWTDLAVLRTTNGWRPSYTARPVRDLQLLADRQTA
jgi:SPP1 gp7 family putative phage head morphogenesis protein